MKKGRITAALSHPRLAPHGHCRARQRHGGVVVDVVRREVQDVEFLIRRRLGLAIAARQHHFPQTDAEQVAQGLCVARQNLGGVLDARHELEPEHHADVVGGNRAVVGSGRAEDLDRHDLVAVGHDLGDRPGCRPEKLGLGHDRRDGPVDVHVELSLRRGGRQQDDVQLGLVCRGGVKHTCLQRHNRNGWDTKTPFIERECEDDYSIQYTFSKYSKHFASSLVYKHF